MSEESKIKSALVRTTCALVLCLVMIIVKFILKNEKIMEEVYNYLVTDIVFFG